MINIFNHRINEVAEHFAANDTSLAVRRLMDCALDTASLTLFKEVLAFCDWRETNTTTDSELHQKGLELLQQIANAAVTSNSLIHKPVLIAEGVAKTYANGNFGLKPVDLTLNAGNIVGLVGQNGHGKTTLLRLLSADLTKDRGSIVYPLLQDKSLYDLRSQLIYIEQRIPRWYGSLMENLQFALAHYGIKGEANFLWSEMMIARMGLRDFRQYSWNSISSGYKTRFEVARALLRRPSILLLDEPLANLDIIAQQTLLQDIRFMGQSLSHPFGTVLSSQHIYEVEKVSDQIVFLNKGVPQYQQTNTLAVTEPTVQPVIIELETSASRDRLQEQFALLGVEKITFNGGVYTLYFPPTVTPQQVLQTLAATTVPVLYFRDISSSSRRFFTS